MASIILFYFIEVIIGIGLLVYYIQNFKEVNKFFKYGAVLVGIIFILELIGGGLQVALSILSFLIAIIDVCIGMHLCSKLNLKDVPLLKKFFYEEDYDKINLKNYIISTVLVVLGTVLFSYLLFSVIKPSISQEYKDILTSKVPLTLRILIFVFAAAMGEEITFRLVIQNYLVKVFNLEGKKYWIAIICSAFLWALAHGTPLSPSWLKFAQVFPIGIALGWLYRRNGLESTMLAHGSFNIIMAFLANGLIKI